MKTPSRKTLDGLTAQRDAAKLKVETALLNRKQKILAKYDAVEPSKSRRQPTRETSSEGQIYDMSRRMLGCNLGRDLERNYSPAKSMIHQFKVNVVGSLGKLRVNGEGGDEATKWFNEVWAKDCDYRDSLDFSTMLQNILAAEIREGDMLAVIDDGITEQDTGKLITWEADQIVPVSDAVLAQSEFKGMVQDNGILRGKMGRIEGYCATGKRGQTVVDKLDDVTFFRREYARLARNPWRLNQGRGVPTLITPSSNLIDLYEMLASELASAKRTAKQYAIVKRKDAVTDWDNPAGSPEFLPENDGRTSTSVAQDGANQATHSAKNYERLEALTGGLTDYIDPDDAVEFPDLKHPNVNMAGFIESVLGFSGSALGLAQAYTRLRADTSYTAFRGDMIMTWVTFYWLQKHLERTVCDWVAIKVLGWAQRKGLVGKIPDGWERRISWTWPTMPEVDTLAAEQAIAAALKNGTVDYAELIGPDWLNRFTSLAAQLEAGRKLKLPLSVYEQKSGGLAVQDEQKDKQDEETRTKGDTQ